MKVFITGSPTTVQRPRYLVEVHTRFPKLNHCRFKPLCHLALEGWPKAARFTRQSPQHFAGGQ
jgi:hypothetical protein